MQRAGSAPGQTSSLVHPVCVPHTKRQALLFILLDEKKASPSQASCSKKSKVPATLAPASQLNCIKKTFNINSPDKQAAEFAQANSSPEMAHSTGGPWPSRTVFVGGLEPQCIFLLSGFPGLSVRRSPGHTILPSSSLVLLNPLLIVFWSSKFPFHLPQRC